MKLNLLITSISLLLSPLLFAHSSPDKCPSVAAIAVVPFQAKPYFGEENVWMLVQTSHYDTNSEWSLTFGPISEKSKELALQKGKNELATLHVDLGPYNLSEGYFACGYSNNNGLFAMAITPPNWPDVTG